QFALPRKAIAARHANWPTNQQSLMGSAAISTERRLHKNSQRLRGFRLEFRLYGRRQVAMTTKLSVIVSAALLSGGLIGHEQAGHAQGGVPVWTNRYIPLVERFGSASSLALGNNRTVFVTGNSGTVAYSNAGAPLWTNLSDAACSAVALDGDGNVFVTGTD